MQVGRRNDHPEWSEAKSKEDKCVARKILIAKIASRVIIKTRRRDETVYDWAQQSQVGKIYSLA
jgi:hypothetical protein